MCPVSVIKLVTSRSSGIKCIEDIFIQFQAYANNFMHPFSRYFNVYILCLHKCNIICLSVYTSYIIFFRECRIPTQNVFYPTFFPTFSSIPFVDGSTKDPLRSVSCTTCLARRSLVILWISSVASLMVWCVEGGGT